MSFVLEKVKAEESAAGVGDEAAGDQQSARPYFVCQTQNSVFLPRPREWAACSRSYLSLVFTHNTSSTCARVAGTEL